MNKGFKIFLIQHIDNERIQYHYIGMTKKNVDQCVKKIKQSKPCQIIGNFSFYLKAYGEDNFETILLDTALDKEEAVKLRNSYALKNPYNLRGIKYRITNVICPYCNRKVGSKGLKNHLKSIYCWKQQIKLPFDTNIHERCKTCGGYGLLPFEYYGRPSIFNKDAVHEMNKCEMEMIRRKNEEFHKRIKVTPIKGKTFVDPLLYKRRKLVKIEF